MQVHVHVEHSSCFPLFSHHRICMHVDVLKQMIEERIDQLTAFKFKGKLMHSCTILGVNLLSHLYTQPSTIIQISQTLA